MPKFLVIRFSSIGDIVLTSPVVRCIKNQVAGAEIHYVTKRAFRQIVGNNPNISKVISFEKEIDEVVDELKKEHYDFVIDLHNNLRSTRLKRKLGRPSAAFPKLNVKKFLLTFFKINRLPDLHVVDRYFKAVEELGVKNDGMGISYFIPEQDEVKPTDFGVSGSYIVYATGAQFATKKMPAGKISELLKKINSTVVLLGGEADFDEGEQIAKSREGIINLCGRLSLDQSASFVKQASKVITHDTGLMHIASAFGKPIVSIWGNTVPAFGMYPYMPQKKTGYTIHEIKGLSCRPCSKIGYQKCPKGHFKCMLDHDLDTIAADLNRIS
jgi:ADP-heptose:LPS heptosyltransferase